MSVIKVLPSHIANLVAAGEVVENPASIVKELMENSIDAGAHNITVEIGDGGMTLVSVTDDGKGMEPTDAIIAFQRHATSKLSSAEQLSRIYTLGFRGEALAAIASVSEVCMQTRAQGARQGVKIKMEYGRLMSSSPVGFPQGTSVKVTSLFRNTPARLRFMRSDRAEGSACQLAALRCALGRPDIAVRFMRGDVEAFVTPGDGSARSAAYILLGRELESSLLPCSAEGCDLKVEGYVSSPRFCRGNRAMQFFFVNGRWFKSAALQAALEAAYKNTMLVGRYPACIIYLTIDPKRVDVNVHPAKEEVKFVDERDVCSAVCRAARAALKQESVLNPTVPEHPGFPRQTEPDLYYPSQTEPERPYYPRQTEPEQPDYPRPPVPDAPPPETAQSELTPEEREFMSQSAGETPEYLRPPVPDEAPPAFETPSPPPDNEYPNPSDDEYDDDDGDGYYVYVDDDDDDDEFDDDDFDDDYDDDFPDEPMYGRENLAQGMLSGLFDGAQSAPIIEAEPEPRILGEVMKTYIVAEYKGRLVLVDKHAAHERLNFEEYKDVEKHLDTDGMRQTLMEPIVINTDGETAERIWNEAEYLYNCGFSIDIDKTGKITVFTAPDGYAIDEIEPTLERLVSVFHSGSASDMHDELLKLKACKAAVKSGDESMPEEWNRLLRDVIKGKINYCPHGRPVAVTLTRAELDRMFMRIT